MSLTTKLEAVNEVLAGIGEAPVSSLSGGFVTASMASAKVDAISREMQELGWNFNTEENYSLVPDTDGFIQLPATVLRVDPVDTRVPVVQRGRKLYNKLKHSFTFTGPVVVTMVVSLDFEDLPEAARSYVKFRAKRLTQNDLLGDPTLHQVQTPEEKAAWARLLQSDSESADHNIFDNYDLADWIRRDLY